MFVVFTDLDRSPTDEELFRLSRLISHKWRDVAHWMEPAPFDQSSLFDFITAHPRNVADQSLAMLSSWIRNVGDRGKIAHVCSSLNRANCRAQAELVFGTTTYKYLTGNQVSAESEGMTETQKRLDVTNYETYIAVIHR